MIFLFSGCVFISAFLVFLIQPMIGKIFLPWVGGAPAAWNTCMFFFQMLLLLGYYYAHASLKKLEVKKQIYLHMFVMAAAAFFLPIVFAGADKIPDIPSIWLLQQLFLTTALPFFVVSATAPLLQKWFFYSNHARAQNPFFLYAASNMGSMTALLAYPLLIEPNFNILQQSYLWAAGFALLAVVLIACSCFVKPEKQLQEKAEKDDLPPVSRPQIKNWLVASFLPSALLLASTHHLTRNLAPVPMLWIVPLIVYLLTFIIAFSESLAFDSRKFTRFSLLILLLFLPIYFFAELTHYAVDISLHMFVLFVISLLCHRHLAETRPAPQKLTEFYLWISLGGLAGSFFNTFIASNFFNVLDEYPIIVMLSTAFLRNRETVSTDSSDSEDQGIKFLPIIISGFLIWFIFEIPLLYLVFEKSVFFARNGAVMAGYCGGFLCQRDLLLKFIVCLIPLVLLRKKRFLKDFNIIVFAAVAVIIFFFIRLDQEGTVVFRTRNFFGIKEVSHLKENDVRQLIQGTTVHGMQSLLPEFRNQPLTYYHRRGPLGDIFTQPFANKEGLEVAVIGLGAGSMMAYAQKNQHFTFYEIDPDIVYLAEESGAFTFLQDTTGSYSIKLGDGRLQMLKAPDSSYDLIILDAFSSGFVPVHLLTREAFAIYLKKLKPDGLVVMNISSRHFDLMRIIRTISFEMSLKCLFVGDYEFDQDTRADFMRYSSDYSVISRSEKNLPLSASNTRHKWQVVQPQMVIKTWTDNYSSIISILF